MWLKCVVSGKRAEGEETTSGSVGFGFTQGLGGATKGFNMEKEEMTTLPHYKRTLD